MERRLVGLDALRGLAALSVVLYHYTVGYMDLVARTSGLLVYLPDGHFGVDLFFMISGFVIFMTLDRSLHVCDFVVSRVARLYPAYVAALCLTTAIVWQSDLTWLRPTAPQIIVNLTMIPEFLGTRPVDPSYWSLAYEVSFYVMAAIVVMRLHGGDRIERICLGWLALAAALRWFPGAAWPTTNLLAAHLVVLLRRFAAAEYAHLFIAGIMLYRVHSGRSTGLSLVVLGLCLAVAAVGPPYSHRPVPVPGLVYAGLVAGFALLVWRGAEGHLGWLSSAPFLFLGEISYPLYLVHQFIGYVIIHRLVAKGIDPNLAVLTALAAASALAFAMTRFVERPAQRRLREIYAAYRDRLVGVAPW